MPTKEFHYGFEYLGSRMAVCRYEYVFEDDEIIGRGVRSKPMPINVTPISVR